MNNYRIVKCEINVIVTSIAVTHMMILDNIAYKLRCMQIYGHRSTSKNRQPW